MGTELFFLPWPGALQEGTLLRRYHRFLAEVRFADGSTVVAHCVNSGRMEGIVRPGMRVWLTHAPQAHRKLKWTWQLLDLDGVLVGANTLLPNNLVRGMLQAGALPGFRSARQVQPEARYGHGSRVDFLLHMRSGQHFLEVKNCHLVYADRRGYFPDSLSQRASRHVQELREQVGAGHRATVLFVVQRADAVAVRPSDLHDPTFAQELRAAARAGVHMRALRVEPRLDGLHVLGELPVDLRTYGLDALRKEALALASSSGWERPPRA